MSRNREIHLAWDIGPDGWRRLTVECDDEATMLLFSGAVPFTDADAEEQLAGDFGRMALNEHRSRCDACQTWSAA